jgi:ABC-type dipeptide/oligopeptide/nickel transport system ATPase component
LACRLVIALLLWRRFARQIRGETLALVGESGSGKSEACLSLVRLVPEAAGRIVGGRVPFEGEDLLRKRATDCAPAWR